MSRVRMTAHGNSLEPVAESNAGVADTRTPCGNASDEGHGWRKSAAVAGALAVIATVGTMRAASAGRAQDPEERTVELESGRSIHLVTAGSGPDIVLLHGALTTHLDWLSGPLEALAEIGRVTAIDRPGHGLSRRRRFEGAPRAQAAQIHEALITLGVSRPVMVAHSFSALTALSYAEYYQEELGAVVLVAPLAFPEYRPLEHTIFAPRALPIFGPMLARLAAAQFDRAMLEAHHQIMFSPDEPPEEWKRNYPWDQILGSAGMVANGEDFAAVHPLRFDSYVDLDLIHAPVRVLSGTSDLIIEDMWQGSLLARRLADASLTRLPGVGHMLHHSRPDALVDAVRSVLPEGEAG